MNTYDIATQTALITGHRMPSLNQYKVLVVLTCYSVEGLYVNLDLLANDKTTTHTKNL